MHVFWGKDLEFQISFMVISQESMLFKVIVNFGG